MDAAIRRIFEEGLGDAKVESISWTDDDLLLDLLLHSAPERKLGLRFEAIARLRIDFDFGDFAGKPLLFSAKVQEVETWWKVIFNFGVAPDGAIEFECAEISERAA